VIARRSLSGQGDDATGFEEVLVAWSWWDCPRAGVALFNGKPHRFTCDFDEELDDYPDVYRVWPISEEALQAELALWQIFSEWRGQFDCGMAVGPFEDDPAYSSVSARVREYEDEAPASARLAIPEWRLDPNRSFAGRVPRHFVRWTIPEGS
jgi:hypothetical protein